MGAAGCLTWAGALEKSNVSSGKKIQRGFMFLFLGSVDILITFCFVCFVFSYILELKAS